MPVQKMHEDELEIDEALVYRLLEAQFPQWAHLPIRPVQSSGTDNSLYRLGDDKVVRFPRIGWAIEQVDKEQKWLSYLAPHLPLPIPVALGKGTPADTYPWNWSIYSWLEGENATPDRINDPIQLAQDLAQFIIALQKIDATDAPLPGSHNSGRGVPLAIRDRQTHDAIARLQGMIDTDLAKEAWEIALQAPTWQGAPVWIHGDLQSGNLLLQSGRLSAVIDFGCLGAGDPACELQIAWNLFTGEARKAFRASLQVDDAMWARGRGWALSVALLALPYYHITNPVLANIARFTIHEVLTDHLNQPPTL